MKKIRVLVSLAICAVLASCTSPGDTSGTSPDIDLAAYAAIPREKFPAMFDFVPFPQTPSETAADSDLIVLGTVKNVETTSVDAILCTYLDFEVESVLKGDIKTGDLIRIEAFEGAMRKSEIRNGYTGALKNAADHTRQKNENTSTEDDYDPLLVQLLPYGGLYQTGTKEVFCIDVVEKDDQILYAMSYGPSDRYVEVSPGVFASFQDQVEAMKERGFSDLEAVDPILMPADLSEDLEETVTLDQIREYTDCLTRESQHPKTKNSSDLHAEPVSARSECSKTGHKKNSCRSDRSFFIRLCPIFALRLSSALESLTAWFEM